MKIAFIKQKYVPYGGGEGYLAGLMDACAEKGHEVHVITTGWDNCQKFPFAVHEAQLNRFSRRSRVVSFAASVAKIVEWNSFDVVFSLERTVSQHIWRAGDCVYSKWLSQRSIYEPRLKTLFNRLSSGQRAVVSMEERCVHSTPFIIANSEMIRRDLQEAYPGLAARISVIHNGFDPARFSPEGRAANRRSIRQELGLADADQVLLFAASGWRRKGLLELMRAMRKLPAIKLLVLGRDRVRDWEKIAQKIEVEQQINFIGPRRDIASFYHAADATILPSWYDSFGFVTLESIASGTPVVASCFAGSHEVIIPGVNGMTISRPDAIEEMHAAVLEALKIRSPETVAQSVAGHTLEKNVGKTLQVIERSVTECSKNSR